MVNVRGFANSKQVYSARIPGISVPHEGCEVLGNGKWWLVLREVWTCSDEVKLVLQEVT